MNSRNELASLGSCKDHENCVAKAIVQRKLQEGSQYRGKPSGEPERERDKERKKFLILFKEMNIAISEAGLTPGF